MRRGLVPSREQAHAAIAAGTVLVRGSVADKPSRMVGDDEPVHIASPPPRFVGRGGLKLDAAMDRFGVDAVGVRALDAGASTGGFTDVLLQRGAAEVVSVDVGYGQLHERLRHDPRVTVLERTNIRHLTVEAAGDFSVIVADLSFISLTAVAPVLAGKLARAGADIVVLVKPQFEAGREAASRGKGVIRQPSEWVKAIERVAAAFAASGAAIMDGMVSPLRGADGNVEFLLHALAHTTGGAGVDASGLAASAEASSVDD